jgi:glycine cleavage system regulatory protein
LAAVDAHVRSQTETIGVLSQGLQALPSYGERVSALHDAIGAVHNRLAAVETSVTRAGDTTGLEARLADLEAAVRPLGEQVAQSRNAATEHAASLAEATRALQQHGASLESLHDRVAAIADGTQAALAVPPVFDESTIAGLEAKLSAISDELAAVRDRGGSAPAADAIAAAVREAELRLRAHVDDAVLALAEMLVRRRPASTAGSGAPASWPEPAPAYEAPEPASAPAPTVAVAPAASVSPPEAASLLDDEAEHATPIVDFSVAEFADEDGDSDLAASSSAAADLDEDEDEDDGGYDEPPAEAEYDDATDVDDDDEDSDDYEDDDYDDDAEDDAADDAAADSAEDGEDLDATSEIKFPRPAVMPPEGTAEASSIPAPPASWSPEVPPERGEPESGGDTIVPEGRKRRWFSR